MKITKNKVIKLIFNFVTLTIGAIIAAMALELFLIPNTILDGGVTGISIIIFKLFHIPLSILVLVLNIPFIYIGYKNLGKSFLVRAIYCMVLFAISLEFFKDFHSFTEDMRCPSAVYHKAARGDRETAGLRQVFFPFA